ncbi:MAG: LamB/YcsF family protein [Pseudomonadota bacterium]
MRAAIDLNCDLGESFGAWTMGEDEAVLPHVSSANVACGFHAGDPTVMRRTVALAKAHGAAVGAHLSLPDLQGFGRREMRVSPDEAYDFTLYQVGALAAIARAQGVDLAHVKPHGALYNMAARDRALADAIAHAVHDLDPSLLLFGRSGSALPAAGDAVGLAVAHEVFADRAYRTDGSLAPRGTAGAVIEEPALAAARAAAFAAGEPVAAVDGTPLRLRADTVCVHGDRAGAGAFARALRGRLDALGVVVRAPRA